MTFNDLQKVNETISKVNIKGKEYAEVFQRVKAFRMLFPNGTIATSIEHMEDGLVVFKAAVHDEDGKILSTGFSYEVEGSNNINRTSFIENCETSAVGRALAFLGIGIDMSIASAEEVINAQNKRDLKPQTMPEDSVALQWQNRTCEICGKPLTPKVAARSFEVFKGHMFCSKECAEKGMSAADGQTAIKRAQDKIEKKLKEKNK